MAYGNTGTISSAYLDVAATTTDDWLGSGTNGIDLFSGHSPFVAILYDNSLEPGGDYQFQQAEGAGGDTWGTVVYGRGVEHAGAPAGISRANQVNAITPVIPALATKTKWVWSHYQGIVFHNYEDMKKNSGKNQVVDLGNMILDQIQADFFDTLATDIMDGAAGSGTKIESVNACLLNTGTVGGIDQSDGANNAWWQAQGDSTAEVWNTTTFDQVRDACYFDTGRKTGIRKPDPDCAFLYGNQYARLRAELKPSQRQEVSDRLRGGAKYLDYDGCKCFRSTRHTSNSTLILNSTTWAFRYYTKMPDPVTGGWTPRSGTPAIWERGYNWLISFGGFSMKHNGLLTNKTP